MSFNIRYGTADDGVHRWERRRDFVADTMLAFAPDLIGTQETLAFQRDFLAERLPDFAHASAGREDGRERGEMCALFYRRERFELLAEGHFWLSETPDAPGSKSWDSSLPRMATWVKLRDRSLPAGAAPVLFVNTHFDHRGSAARRESAALLRTRAALLGRDCLVVITGDFNDEEGSRPYQALFADGAENALALRDSFRARHATRGDDEGTFSGFRAESTRGPRIDWIAASPQWEVLQAAIDRTSRDGATPSDHFPVTAVLRRSVAASGME